MKEAVFRSSANELAECLYRLYGNSCDLSGVVQEVESMARKTFALVSEKKAEKKGFRNVGATSGYIIYTDLFAGDFRKLQKKIAEIADKGYSYVHIMPPYKCPDKENDGGYAVSSYSELRDDLGSMEDLSKTVSMLHRKGIRVAVDFILNHTSNEHEWAKKALAGDSEYQGYYFMYDDKREVDEWNTTVREIFPQVRRGSFTWLPELGKWVWTTFNSFQWDLNYKNPRVFVEMCRQMFALAELGADVLRFDALAFVWKKKWTCCESLEETQILISAFQYAARMACPDLMFKSEAIVHPDDVRKYIGRNKCSLSYNPLQMALFWEALATRSTSLLNLSLKKRWHVDENSAWVNYIRCHDDIGWTFSDEDARECGIDGYDHRKFLNAFYTGRFPGTFAKGEAFQLNEDTGDCRVCGTMASLAGLEQAFDMHNAGDSRAELYAEMAVKRICMMYSLLFMLPGIPLVYSGDENAVLNDYSYREDESKKADSRWVHRIKYSSGKKGADPWLQGMQEKIACHIKALAARREELFSFTEFLPRISFFDLDSDRLFGFRLIFTGEGGETRTADFVANFSESEEKFLLGENEIELGGYGFYERF